MSNITPAIIPENPEQIREALSKVEGLVDTFQIDVVDGEFVPSKSWPYTKGNIGELADIVTPLLLEIDLMVSKPETVIDQWIDAGANRIVLHIESTEKIAECLREGVECGIAIGVHTPVEMLVPYLSDVDFIQCMGIEKIGYQGQKFDARVLDTITFLREKFEGSIQVDGGVSPETIRKLQEAGADRFVSGSYIFTSRDIEEAIKTLST